MALHYQKFYIDVNQWPYPPYHDPVCIYYLLHPEDFEIKPANIEVDTGKTSRGRTNCYFLNEKGKEATTFVTTNMCQPLDKFWEEVLGSVKVVFSEGIQSRV
jgi:inosine-uridine nucleoside N-ribohydrolase